MGSAVIQRYRGLLSTCAAMLAVNVCLWWAPAAAAMEQYSESAAPDEYWFAEWPPGIRQQDQAGASSPSLHEINWDEATAVDLENLLDIPPAVTNPFEDFYYRGAGYAAQTQWLLGKRDELGIFSLQFLGESGTDTGAKKLDLGVAVHFISGPVQTDLPPRVYDFTLGLPFRGTIGESWRFDLMFRTGWYSDFEGSAREGIRFPSHLVLYQQATDWWQWVLGVDYLDRDDIRLLPVFGALWIPGENWRFEAVFPRPLIGHRVRGNRWFYFAAQMGGGTWDIRRQWGAEDVFTYRDLQLLLGVEGFGLGSFLEVGYVFQRHLEYRSGTPLYQPPDALLLRSVLRF
jgi:hypothetical protein